MAMIRHCSHLGRKKMRYLLVITIVFFIAACTSLSVTPEGSTAHAVAESGVNVGSHVLVLSNVFPITVIAAIVLFVFKEIVELIKRSREKARKISAYKILIAEEMLKNAWALIPLRMAMEKLDDLKRQVSIIHNSDGSCHLLTSSSDEQSKLYIQPFYSAIFDKYLVDIAVIDKSFFSKIMVTYQSIAEARVGRATLFELSADPVHDFSRQLYIAGLRNTLAVAEDSIKQTYSLCTGKELNAHKQTSFI
jgi:hypothetical protein